MIEFILPLSSYCLGLRPIYHGSKAYEPVEGGGGGGGGGEMIVLVFGLWVVF